MLLAAITPASGFVGPAGALGMGRASGGACYFASVVLKLRFGWLRRPARRVRRARRGRWPTTWARCSRACLRRRCSAASGAISTSAASSASELLAAPLTALYAGGMTWAIAKGVDALVGMHIGEIG